LVIKLQSVSELEPHFVAEQPFSADTICVIAAPCNTYLILLGNNSKLHFSPSSGFRDCSQFKKRCFKRSAWLLVCRDLCKCSSKSEDLPVRRRRSVAGCWDARLRVSQLQNSSSCYLGTKKANKTDTFWRPVGAAVHPSTPGSVGFAL